jgi:putative transposase
MPDHIHLLLTPTSEVSLEKAMQYIKGGFSFRLKSKLDVWERSYTNHRITNARDYITHITYIHQNPIRANLISDPELYSHSSANPNHPPDTSPTHLL